MIEHGIGMQISIRTTNELLTLERKEDLAADIQEINEDSAGLLYSFLYRSVTEPLLHYQAKSHSL